MGQQTRAGQAQHIIRQRYARKALARAIGHAFAVAGLSTAVMLPVFLPGSANAADASTAGTSAPASRKAYDIPAGPLEVALNRFGREAGLLLSFPTETTAGLQSKGLRGSYSVQEALPLLLQGTGLAAVAQSNGGYALVKRTVTAASTVAEGEATLPVVVVSGEKIERKLSETLSSVAVATAKNIEEHGDNSMADVLARTPGVYTQSGNENWGIRGVPVSGFDDQGPLTTNAAVSVLMDGAVQSHRFLTLSPLPLWDVEQVEVFRGAQSTTQGRNALAGAVVVQTRNPSHKPTLAAQANVGTYGERGGAAVIGGGIVQGMLAGRLAVDYQEADGYIRNETLQRPADPYRSVNVRGKLLFQPTERLDALLTLTHSQYRTGDNGVATIDNQPQYYQLPYNTDAYDKFKQNTATVKLDYYLSDAWTLTSISSITRSELNELLDLDQRPTVAQEAVRAHDNQLFNQELRFGYGGPQVRGHAGVYYGHTRQTHNDRIDVNGSTIERIEGEARIVNQAVFGEVNWDFAPRWQAIAGLRYDHERNDTAVRYPLDLFGFSKTAESVNANEFNAALPKFGLSYRLAEDHLIGGTVQRGYRSGGVNVRANTSHDPYNPEFTTNYELSYRGALLDKKLTLGANLYYTDWKDQQVRIEDASAFITIVNAASSRMQGFELSADYNVSSALRFSGGFAFNDTKYREFVSDAGDLSGQAFLYAPKSKLTLGGAYRFSNGLQTNIDVVYQSDRPSGYITDGSGNVTGSRRADAVTLVNLNAGYKLGKHVLLTGYVKNLFDEKYITNKQSGRTMDVGAPRTVGVALRYDM